MGFPHRCLRAINHSHSRPTLCDPSMMKWLLLVLAIPAMSYAQSCTQTFTTANVGTSPYPGSNVNTAIQGGTTSTVLCFSAGNYGEIDVYAANPTGSGQLQIIPVPGATVTGIYFNFNGVSNVKITGFCDTDLPSCPTSNGSNTGGLLVSNAGQGNSSNITYSYNSMTTNGVQVQNNPNANAAILIDHNSFVGFATSNESSRLNMVSDSGCPNGITISNNIISGGESDGINTSGASCGTQIINND